MPNYKKRNTYQTGGATKPMRPRTMQSMPMATGQRMATGSRTAASQEAERKRQEAARRHAAMMKVGNRQRAAAARARTQDLRNTPRKLSPTQQRLVDSYNRGMAQQRQQRAMGRPAPQTRPPARMPTPSTFQAAPMNSTSNQARNVSPALAAERRRLQQQIAQLQARLRQLGG
jgi:hypothetical protein